MEIFVYGLSTLVAVVLAFVLPAYLAHRGWVRGQAFAKEHKTHVRLDSEAAKGFALGSGLGLISVFIPGLNLMILIAWIGAQFFWPKMQLRPKLSLGEVALQAFTLTPIGTFAFFLSVESALQANSRDVVVN